LDIPAQTTSLETVTMQKSHDNGQRSSTGTAVSLLSGGLGGFVAVLVYDYFADHFHSWPHPLFFVPAIVVGGSASALAEHLWERRRRAPRETMPKDL
jgi:hypothetical protein